MNNNIVTSNAKEKVFLDTAFLASFSIDSHKDFSKAQKLLSELVLKYEMHTSPLCFYELWKVVKKHNDYNRGNKRFLRKFNRILKFIHITNLSGADIKMALYAIDNFDQKPGDAFHFSSIKNLGINFVVTGNKKDFEKMGFKVIWF